MIKGKIKKQNVKALKKFLDEYEDELEIIIDEDIIMFVKPYELLLLDITA